MKKAVDPEDRKSAQKKALTLLKDRDYTEERLRKKLLDSGYSLETAEETLQWAKEHRFVDDAIYCRLYIEQQSSKKSRLRMKADLMGRGVSRDVVEEALSSIPDEGGELEAAVEKLRSRRYRPDETDPGYIQKTAAYLFRQGFSGEVIRKAMSLDTESYVN